MASASESGCLRRPWATRGAQGTPACGSAAERGSQGVLSWPQPGRAKGTARRALSGFPWPLPGPPPADVVLLPRIALRKLRRERELSPASAAPVPPGTSGNWSSPVASTPKVPSPRHFGQRSSQQQPLEPGRNYAPPDSQDGHQVRVTLRGRAPSPCAQGGGRGRLCHLAELSLTAGPGGGGRSQGEVAWGRLSSVPGSAHSESLRTPDLQNSGRRPPPPARCLGKSWRRSQPRGREGSGRCPPGRLTAAAWPFCSR